MIYCIIELKILPITHELESPVSDCITILIRKEGKYSLNPHDLKITHQKKLCKIPACQITGSGQNITDCGYVLTFPFYTVIQMYSTQDIKLYLFSHHYFKPDHI